jgi:hypothetical protein
MDMEVQEVILAEDQARGLHPFDGWDLSAELEEIHARVDGIAGEHVAEARRLSQLAVGISNALVNLGMLHIWDIPLFLKSAQEVLTVAGLLLECLWEAWASGAGPPVASCYSSRLLLLFLLFFAFGAVVIYIYIRI